MLNYTLAALFALTAPFLTAPPELHPALQMPAPEVQARVWQAGYKRADRGASHADATKKARRTIGRVAGEEVSWITFCHPRWEYYTYGFQARKKEAPREKGQPIPVLDAFRTEKLTQLRFFCQIGIHPNHGGLADKTHLENIEAEMHVGNRVYLPVKQPGNVFPHPYTKIVVPEVCVGSYHETLITEQNPLPVQRMTIYDWYYGEFSLLFDLYNPDGTPRITTADKEITIVVRGRFGRQRATFRLKDWLTAFEN